MLPLARVRGVIVWGGDFINGVQVIYEVPGLVQEGIGNGSCSGVVTLHGPVHKGDHGDYGQSILSLDVESGEVVTEVAIRGGAIIDHLRIKTSRGQEKRWGGGGGGTEVVWPVPANQAFIGFHGGVGGHMHSLGIATIVAGGEESALANVMLSESVLRMLYSTDKVKRAVAQLLALQETHEPLATSLGTCDRTEMEVEMGGAKSTAAEEDALTLCRLACKVAVRTARIYVAKLLASPSDPLLSRIRLGNNFFDRKIGCLLGGGGLMRALGFEAISEGGQVFYVHQKDG
ncbi:unnamed protein product, partial [Choristocarpus tenellus]